MLGHLEATDIKALLNIAHGAVICLNVPITFYGRWQVTVEFWCNFVGPLLADLRQPHSEKTTSLKIASRFTSAFFELNN